jgi:FkbM family methyltransferase
LTATWVFDQEHYQALNASREKVLRSLIQEQREPLALRSAIDIGCGLGYFSSSLSSLGLNVVGVDARQENVEEARRRHPGIEFHAIDAEQASASRLGQFDLVLCFGLLYHLENPFRVIRNLAGLSTKLVLIEGMVYPSPEPIMALLDENNLKDQGLHYLAFYPSEACLAKMLFRAGFSNCFLPNPMPDHPFFQPQSSSFRIRSMLAASRVPLSSKFLTPYPEPDQGHTPWSMTPLYAARGSSQERSQAPPSDLMPKDTSLLRRIRKFAAKPWRSQFRSFAFRWLRFFPAVPLPFRLRFGAWWLLRNDQIARTLLEDAYENEEHRFVERFLQPGMTVLDIGANQGYYTLLASRKVGPQGKVFAFEPSAREVRHLKLHLWLNRNKNIRVVRSALGADTGTANLHVVLGTESGCNSLRPPNVGQPTSLASVPVERLDDVLKAHGVSRVDFIKLDVEGAELSVLRGAQELLLRSPRPVILIEVQDIRTQPWGYPARQIISFLSDLGYVWFRPKCSGQLERIPPDNQIYDGNFVAISAQSISSFNSMLISR